MQRDHIKTCPVATIFGNRITQHLLSRLVQVCVAINDGFAYILQFPLSLKTDKL